MSDRALIPVLVSMMLLTGVCNTLLTKYQDLQCVRNCDPSDVGKPQHFEQPVLQTAQMFIGEMGCWLIVGLSALWNWVSAMRKGYSPIDGGGGENTNIVATDAGPVEAAAGETEPLTGAGIDGEGHPVKIAEASDMPALKGWPVLLLALPATCDITGTTLMNVGLLFVAASIYQMTRGALVLFVGLFSVIFLRHKLGPAKWLSLVVVVLGVALVGLAGALQKYPQKLPDGSQPNALGGLVEHVTMALFRRQEDGVPEAPVVENEALRTVLGVLMIAGAQIFTATQFVLEEFILHRWSIDPIRVVGWEGLFGFIVTVFGMIILHVTVGSTDAGRYGYFDAVEGWRQFTEYPAIFTSSILIMISIGGFNYFGLSVTRTISATSRSTIDTCRTLFIWIVSLGLGWETFKWLQVAGFALLVYGTFLFNDILKAPFGLGKKREENPPAYESVENY